MRLQFALAGLMPLLTAIPALGEPVDRHVSSGAVVHSNASFILPKESQFKSEPPLKDGMIVQEEVTPNEGFGLGLVSMSGRNIHSVRIEQEPVPTQNPGVTFVIKFRP